MRKREKFEDDLLAPDSEIYDFDVFFWPDMTTGRIEIRSDIPQESQRRAECTLRLYGLNDINNKGHCAQRLAAQERRSELRAGHQSLCLPRFPSGWRKAITRGAASESRQLVPHHPPFAELAKHAILVSK